MQRKRKRKNAKVKKRVPKPKAKPDQPPVQQMRVKPFSVIRDLSAMPFKAGQGVTLAGWQFEITSVLNNGSMNMRPIGRIVEQKGLIVEP